MKNIVWDWNGTLLDDRDFCVGILNTMLSGRGIPAVSVNRYLEIFTFPIIRYYEQVGFDFEKEPYPVLADEFMAHYDHGVHAVGLFEGAKDILAYFKEAGIKQYILSATREKELIDQVKSRGIDGYFEEICGTDTILAHGKKEIAEKWAKRHKNELSGSIFIGDTLHDREVADIMGIGCIFFSGGHMSKARLFEAGIPIIDHYEELKKWIGEWK